jgi:hypothetical protein
MTRKTEFRLKVIISAAAVVAATWAILSVFDFNSIKKTRDHYIVGGGIGETPEGLTEFALWSDGMTTIASKANHRRIKVLRQFDPDAGTWSPPRTYREMEAEKRRRGQPRVSPTSKAAPTKAPPSYS